MPPKNRPLAGYATKTQALSAHLTEVAAKLGPGARLPTMQQLSAELGISVMTLNRALSELEAQGIVVRRQGSGTYVGDRLGMRSVGLVYDRDVFAPGTSPFAGLLLREAERRASEHNEKFSVFLAAPSSAGLPVHDDLADAIRNRRLSGLLFAGESNPAALKWLLRQRLPLVALSYAPVAPYRVMINHAQIATLGVEALADQGCERIGLWIPAGVGIGPTPGGTDFEELAAFRAALACRGLEYSPELVANLSDLTSGVPSVPPQTNQLQGFEAVHATFGPAGSDNPPDGLVILDDMMTSGAVPALSRLGLKPGEDVRVATHSNHGSHLLFGLNDYLTLLEVDPGEIATQMFALLEVLLKGEEPRQNVVSIGPRVILPSG